jgi:hypothetical protein
MRKHYNSRFPTANVNRLNEVIATNTYFQIPYRLMFVFLVMAVSWQITGMTTILIYIYVSANIKFLVALGDGARNYIKASGTLCNR